MQTVTITTDGSTVTVATQGFSGKGCVKVTEDLTKALGKVTSTQKTPEFYQPEVVHGQRQGR